MTVVVPLIIGQVRSPILPAFFFFFFGQIVNSDIMSGQLREKIEKKTFKENIKDFETPGFIHYHIPTFYFFI